jgi:hypothetical protein
MLTALLLDIGDVLTEIPWNSLKPLRVRTGLPIAFEGALDPGSDPTWQSYLDGSIGMTGVLVDPINKELAYDRARALLGVRPATEVTSHAGEFWTMQSGRLIEWRAYKGSPS